MSWQSLSLGITNVIHMKFLQWICSGEPPVVIGSLSTVSICVWRTWNYIPVNIKTNEKPVIIKQTVLPFHLVCHSGPSCSKLTTLLVNISLKFQALISEICQYFFLKKCEKLFQCKSFYHFFSTKNISVFGYKVIKHLTSSLS